MKTNENEDTTPKVCKNLLENQKNQKNQGGHFKSMQKPIGKPKKTKKTKVLKRMWPRNYEYFNFSGWPCHSIENFVFFVFLVFQLVFAYF